MTGGAVVAGSYQGYATDYLVTTLRELGDTFVGVAQLPTLAPRIAELPRVSVDHLGLSAEEMPALFDLVASGASWTGGRVTADSPAGPLRERIPP